MQATLIVKLGESMGVQDAQSYFKSSMETFNQAIMY